MGENNPEADALSLGYYMSDDPYVAPSNPLVSERNAAHLRSSRWAAWWSPRQRSRAALSRFVSSDGDLDAHRGSHHRVFVSDLWSKRGVGEPDDRRPQALDH